MSPWPTKEEKARIAARKERVPLGVPRMKLKTSSREGYHRRFVNDWYAGSPDRLQEAQTGGYEFVTDPTKVGDSPELDAAQPDSRVSKIVGTRPDGQPIRAYLMEIKQEFYDEDQAAKMASIDEVEKQMFAGKDGQGEPGRDGRYVPRGAMKLKQTLSRATGPD